MNDYVLYILMRTDLQSMSTGRAAAQASHASNAFIHKFGNRIDVKQWQKQTKQGFGTAIVLAADKLQIDEIFNSDVLVDWLVKDWVIDPDYVVPITMELSRFIVSNKITQTPSSDPTKVLLHRVEQTCAYVFGTKEELYLAVGDLPLYP